MESGRVAALSIHQPLSIFIVSLFRLLRFLYPPAVYATFALSLSFYRVERAENSVSNSHTRTSGSLCEYYSALHSRFFCREMPYRDAPLHLRAKMSIRSCFSTGSFLHKFSVSLRPFVLFCTRRAMSIIEVEGRNVAPVFMCIRRIRCVSRDDIANGDVM